MKEISQTALTYLKLSHPNARVETVDGVTTVYVPMYDMETDRAWIETKRVIKDPQTTPMGILPVFNIRTGPVFNPDGDVKVSPLGHLYRILGVSPGKKDDAK